MLRVITILFAGILFCGCLPSPELEGEVEIKDINDTLVVDYDLVYNDEGFMLRADSLFFRLPYSDTSGQSDSLIYFYDSTSFVVNTSEKKSRIDNKPRIIGKLTYTNFNPEIQKYSFRVIEYNTKTQQSFISSTRPFLIRPDPNPHWGITFSVGIISLDKSALPSEVRNARGKIQIGAEGGLMGRWRKWRSHLNFGIIGSQPHSENGEQKDSKSITYIGLDLSRDFKFAVIRRLSPFLGIESFRLEVVDAPEEYTIDDFGMVAGLRLGWKFDELSYSYNTHHEGFHLLEYKACTWGSPISRMGTIYSFYHGNKIRMFWMRFYFEGIFTKNPPINYYYDSNIIHDILAVGFLTPLFLLDKLVRK